MARPSNRFLDFEGKDIRARIFKSVLVYLKKVKPEVDINEICLQVGVSPDRIFEKDGWLSAEEAFGLQRQVEKLTDDSLFLFKAGQFGVSEKFLGKGVTLMLRHLLSVTSIYKNLTSIIRQFNRTIELEISKPKLWKSELVLVARLSPSALKSSKGQLLRESFSGVILNVLGYLTAIPKVKGFPEAKVSVLKMSQGPSGNLEYVISVKYLDLGFWSWGLFAITFLLLPLLLLISKNHFTLGFMGGFSENQILYGLAGALLILVANLSLSLFKARKFIEENGNLADESLDKSESLEKIESLVSSTLPKNLLALAGVKSFGGVKPGQVETKNLTVLVVDLIKFTEISEKRGTAESFDLLNCFFSKVSEVVLKSSGVVDKFIGGSALCYFPNSPDDALSAVQMLRKEIENLNQNLSLDFPLKIRAGIHYGPVMVGVVGSQSFFEVTGMGNTVNTTIGLDAIHKRFGSEVLISQEALSYVESQTVDQIQSKLRFLGRQVLRGLTKEISLYAMSFENALDESSVKQFETAVRKYEIGEISRAEEIFKSLNQRFPQDIIIKKCLENTLKKFDRREG